MMSSSFIAPLVVRVRFSPKSSFIRPITHTLHFHPARKPSRILMTLATDASSPAPSSAMASPDVSSRPLFQCPSCKNPYPPIAALKLSDFPPACPNCKSKVLQRDGFIDLTSNPSESPSLLRNLLTQRPGQALFQLPTTSFAYERGWRDNFSRAGFPGIDQELDLFLDFAAPADVALDMSCGSGLMARRLATSGEFQRVVAADYSQSMLKETVSQARKDIKVPEFDVVRADVSALPFLDECFDVVHSGAALHCWPNVQDGLAEISRILKPGGKFFATTFLKLAYLPNRDRLAVTRPRLLKAAIRIEELTLYNMSFRFFEVDELEFLFKVAGFEVEVETIKGCAIIRAQKPAQS